jgi:hypothetical protein
MPTVRTNCSGELTLTNDDDATCYHFHHTYYLCATERTTTRCLVCMSDIKCQILLRSHRDTDSICIMKWLETAR